MGKAKCDKCGKIKRIRNLIFFKGEYICHECKMKIKTASMMKQFPVMISLNEVLRKIYKVHLNFHGDGKYAYCNCSFPKILAGKKFKITLIEEEPKIKQ